MHIRNEIIIKIDSGKPKVRSSNFVLPAIKEECESVIMGIEHFNDITKQPCSFVNVQIESCLNVTTQALDTLWNTVFYPAIISGDIKRWHSAIPKVSTALNSFYKERVLESWMNVYSNLCLTPTQDGLKQVEPFTKAMEELHGLNIISYIDYLYQFALYSSEVNNSTLFQSMCNCLGHLSSDLLYDVCLEARTHLKNERLKEFALFTLACIEHIYGGAKFSFHGNYEFLIETDIEFKEIKLNEYRYKCVQFYRKEEDHDGYVWDSDFASEKLAKERLFKNWKRFNIENLPFDKCCIAGHEIVNAFTNYRNLDFVNPHMLDIYILGSDHQSRENNLVDVLKHFESLDYEFQYTPGNPIIQVSNAIRIIPTSYSTVYEVMMNLELSHLGCCYGNNGIKERFYLTTKCLFSWSNGYTIVKNDACRDILQHYNSEHVYQGFKLANQEVASKQHDEKENSTIMSLLFMKEPINHLRYEKKVSSVMNDYKYMKYLKNQEYGFDVFNTEIPKSFFLNQSSFGEYYKASSTSVVMFLKKRMLKSPISFRIKTVLRNVYPFDKATLLLVKAEENYENMIINMINAVFEKNNLYSKQTIHNVFGKFKNDHYIEIHEKEINEEIHEKGWIPVIVNNDPISMIDGAKKSFAFDQDVMGYIRPFMIADKIYLFLLHSHIVPMHLEL